MERYMTVSEARQRFLKLVDETMKGDQIVVTKRGKPAVALIDFEHLQSLKAFAALWQDADAMAAMKEAFEDVKGGRVVRMKRMPAAGELLKIARARVGSFTDGRGSKIRSSRRASRGSG
jgi:prevent-host-death family protein